MPANEEGLFRLSERLLERLSNSPSAKREPADESPADAAAPDWRAPGTVLRHVQAVLGELLDQVEPDIHASLHDLGVDSIMGGILVQRINRAFPDTTSPVDLYTFPTAAAMAEQILAVLRSREADEPAPGQETTEEERMLSMLRALKAGSVSIDATMDRFQKGMGK
jgi:acyl carrier protein